MVDTLLWETNGENVLDFFYDASGTPVAFKYNDNVYYYITNLQGDVIRLVDSHGNTAACYEYDPYGNAIDASGSRANINPLRYRGYYYDNETGLYYLQSRYYDPVVGRFISSDSYASTGQGIIEHNMFTYCGGNPITRIDESGDIWHIAVGAVVGAGFGIVTKVITNKISGAQWNSGILSAAVAGAVSGGLAASGVGLAGQIVGNAAISMTNNAADQIIAMNQSAGTEETTFNVTSMLVDGAIGALAGYAGGAGAGSKGLTNIGLTNLKRTWNAFTNKGVKVAAATFEKGLSYFAKNAGYIREPLVTAMKKSSATVIGSTIVKTAREKRLAAMERRLGFENR